MDAVSRVKKRFNKGVVQYNLIEDGDTILVGLSGGKDSLALLDLLAERSRIYKPRFSVMAAHVAMGNIAYQSDIKYLQDFAEAHGVSFFYRETSFDSSTDFRKSPCFLCSWNRRKALFTLAKECGCNKIALGHHFNDVIETVLMSMMYSSEIKTMLPKLRSTNFEGMELIRPLYRVKEKDIIAFAKYNGLEFLQCACKFTEESTQKEDLSKRKEIKSLIEYIKTQNPEADDNIFRSLHNVNLAALPGWRERDSGEVHSFTEDY